MAWLMARDLVHWVEAFMYDKYLRLRASLAAEFPNLNEELGDIQAQGDGQHVIPSPIGPREGELNEGTEADHRREHYRELLNSMTEGERAIILGHIFEQRFA